MHLNPKLIIMDSLNVLCISVASVFIAAIISDVLEQYFKRKK
jgi:hypothetical protein